MSGRAIKTEHPFSPPATFPDPATCRVKAAGFGDYMDCLNKWGVHCPFSLHFADSYLCRHPLKQAILERTELKVEWAAENPEPSE